MHNVRRTLDKAIKAMKANDRMTIEEEDGVEIVYDGGYYILYVDGRAIADGSLEKMKRMMKEELRNR